MKAERRHELKESDLASALHGARDYLQKNGTQIGLAVVIVIVVVGAVSFTVRSRAAAIEDVWRRKAQLTFDDLQTGKTSLEALANMTAGVTDTQFVFTSLIDQARSALELSQKSTLPPDLDLNDTARRALNELLQRFPDHPFAIGIGHSGLATVAANDFVLDSDPAHKANAKAHLTAIIDDARLNGMPFQRAAADRLAALDPTFTHIIFEYPEPEELPEEAPAPDDQTDPADPIDNQDVP